MRDRSQWIIPMHESRAIGNSYRRVACAQGQTTPRALPARRTSNSYPLPAKAGSPTEIFYGGNELQMTSFSLLINENLDSDTVLQEILSSA